MTTNEIGRIVEVHAFHVNIELSPGQRSPVRAGLDGASTQIKLNAYVTFDLGAGDSVLGVITDLYSREVYEPGDANLSLELVRPRRTATAQLLGTVRSRSGGYEFDPGVGILPTLDTPALPAPSAVLRRVLEDAPNRNRPLGFKDKIYDSRLLVGQSTAAQERTVYASYNDCYSRPLAVVGNTGSGKSCSIAHLVQRAMRDQKEIDGGVRRPRFFLLDVNGEYNAAFRPGASPYSREPNRIYVDGQEFSMPLWLMNAAEACVWLNAAEQTQQPALVNLWALAKSATQTGPDNISGPGAALQRLSQIHHLISNPSAFNKGVDAKSCWQAAKSHLPALANMAAGKVVEDILLVVREQDKNPLYSKSFDKHEARFSAAVAELISGAEKVLNSASLNVEQTADKPLYFPMSRLDNPAHLRAAAELSPGDRSMDQFLLGLHLRIQNRRTDKRWRCFYNFDALGIKDAGTWFGKLGVGLPTAPEISVIDCSMVSHDVLPYICGVFGRMLLELREHVDPQTRFQEPWVIVLEEAHNYISPKRAEESRGVAVSRQTFERIAKEGRKFGLSLIVASQRPSEISATVLSQCANFLIHRLQNPDDIEHFRRIVPTQTRRLLDQITILRAGEAIVVGSAFNVPSRVQVNRPDPEPTSESASPFIAWQSHAPAFQFDAAIGRWTGGPADDFVSPEEEPTTPSDGVNLEITDDDVPF